MQAAVEEGGGEGRKGARTRLQEPQQLQHQGAQRLPSLSSRVSVTISISLDLDFCQ